MPHFIPPPSRQAISALRRLSPEERLRSGVNAEVAELRLAEMAVLRRHAVRFVVVGHTAAALRGLPVKAATLDVLVDDDADNVSRLQAALGALPPSPGYVVPPVRARVSAPKGSPLMPLDYDFVVRRPEMVDVMNLGSLDVQVATAEMIHHFSRREAAELVGLASELRTAHEVNSAFRQQDFDTEDVMSIDPSLEALLGDVPNAGRPIVVAVASAIDQRELADAVWEVMLVERGESGLDWLF